MASKNGVEKKSKERKGSKGLEMVRGAMMFAGDTSYSDGMYIHHKDEIRGHFKSIMELMGLDMQNPNLEESPGRVLDAWAELLDGMFATGDRVERIMSKKFPADYSEMVAVRDIRTTGICPHHFLPIEYSITLAYVPSGTGYCIGLSKLPRLAVLLAHRPVLQEKLTNELADAIQYYLDPKGVGVRVVGRHGCMCFRGINQPTSDTVTQQLLGTFRDLPEVRAEFTSHANTPTRFG